MKKSDDLRTKILLAALPDVAFDGWTEDVLDRAARRLKLSPEKIHAVFPHGIDDLVLYFPVWADAQMLKKLSHKALKDLRVRDKVALGVRKRLEVLTPHKQAVAASLSHLAPPPKSLHLPKIVWRTADIIWRTAGDTATDYNHYTKRLLLSGVITSTTLYWLNDDSGTHKKTWGFLDRRIEEVLKVGRTISSWRERRKA